MWSRNWTGIAVVSLVVGSALLVVKPWSHESPISLGSQGKGPGSPSDKLARENANTRERHLLTPAPGNPRMIAASSEEDWHKFDNPSQDGWASEAFSDAAAKQLGQIGSLLEHPQELASAGFNGLAGKSFHCKPLVPQELVTVLKDRNIEVQRQQPGALQPSEPLFVGPKGLGQALQQIADSFHGAKLLRSKFKIFRVQRQQDATLTRQYVELSGLLDDGVLQQHATWEALWDRSEPTAPRLVSLKVIDFEQVRSQTPAGTIFADITRSVLEHNPCYKQQFMHGMNHWLARIPNSRSLANFGHPGMAVGDVNGDGLEDLYVCQEQGLPNRLFLQNADGSADEVSGEWGVDWLQNARSALLIDLDNDSDQDLVVGFLGGVVIASNEDNSGFRVQSVTQTNEDVMSLSAADFDGDGDLDIYAVAYYADDVVFSMDEASGPAAAQNLVYHDANIGGHNSLLRNDYHDDVWAFVDVTAGVGLDVNNSRYSLASAWEDFDNDGDQDLYVANDYGRDNLYRNDGGRFVDVGDSAGAEDAASGMSVAWADFDRDGWMDAYVANMWSSAGNRITFQPEFKADSSTDVKQRLQRFARGNTLLKNNRDHTFVDVSRHSGVEMGRWAWSSQWADLNNDGWEDILIANGYLTGNASTGDL
jgi:hypothetical protein